MRRPDFVFVKDLAVRTISGVDAWKRPQAQPLLVSIFVNTDIRDAGATDELSRSLNYDVLSRKVTQESETSRFKSLSHVAEAVAGTVLKDTEAGTAARIHIKKPRSLLRAESSEIVISRVKEENGMAFAHDTLDKLKINGLRLVTTIGVNHIERLHTQNVLLDLTMFKPAGSISVADKVDPVYDFRNIAEHVAEHVEAANYNTVEAFVESVAQVVLGLGIEKVKVAAAKPSALTFAELAGVEIVRTRANYREPVTKQVPSGSNLRDQSLFPQKPVDDSKELHSVYLAFGTNLGDTIGNVERSLSLLEEKGINVVRTSRLYESHPMYVQDQNKFLNGVFACTTRHNPHDVLRIVKEIEYDEMSRVKTVQNGPRTIDLDVLLYDDIVLNTEDLHVPHLDMLNRSFVLQPLVDVAPAAHHPLTAESFADHLAQLPSISGTQASTGLTELIPMYSANKSPRSISVDPIGNTLPTMIMAIVNLTPDSFSDGGENNLGSLVQKALSFVENGASILDVGGLSTRPGSDPCSEDEELARVIPAIKTLRSDPRLDKVAISVDTYRAKVAREALIAGANMVNDVFSGTMDPDMFSVVREMGAPIILSHSRGDTKTMNQLANYETSSQDLSNGTVATIGYELARVVETATDHGIKGWQIILDPGIGFAKNYIQNLEIIQHFQQLKTFAPLSSFPWVVGPSRKGFIGRVTGVKEPKRRVMGTAATVTALIQQGVDIVRVHDVTEITETVLMADAIYKEVIKTR